MVNSAQEEKLHEDELHDDDVLDESRSKLAKPGDLIEIPSLITRTQILIAQKHSEGKSFLSV